MENSIVVKRVLHRASSINAAKSRLSISCMSHNSSHSKPASSQQQMHHHEEKLNKQFDYFRREFMDAALASGVTVPLDMLEDATGRLFGFVQLKGPRYLLHIMDTEIDNGHLLRCSLSLLIVTINILRFKLPSGQSTSKDFPSQGWISSVAEGFSTWAAEAVDKIADSYAVTICIKLLKYTHVQAIQELTLNLLSQVVTISTEAADFMLQSPYVKDHDVNVGGGHRHGHHRKEDHHHGHHGKSIKHKLTGISRRPSFDKHPLNLLSQKLAPPSSAIASPAVKHRKSHVAVHSDHTPAKTPAPHTSHEISPNRQRTVSGSFTTPNPKPTAVPQSDSIAAATAVHASLTSTATTTQAHTHSHADVSCLSYLLSICATNRNRFALISSCAEIVIVMTASGDSNICEEVARTCAFPKQNFRAPAGAAHQQPSLPSTPPTIHKTASQGSMTGAIGLLRSKSKSALRSKSSTNTLPIQQKDPSAGTSTVPPPAGAM